MIFLNILGFFDVFMLGFYYFDGQVVYVNGGLEVVSVCVCMIGFVFQVFYFFEGWFVVDSIELNLLYWGILCVEWCEKVFCVVVVVGFDDCLYQSILILLGGQW